MALPASPSGTALRRPSQGEASAPAWARGPLVHKMGRYDVGPLLGSGGMGEVHEAWDPSLSRTVALKILHTTEPMQMLRFLREAQLQARVEHPNICQVYEVDASGERPCIAMQLIHGPTLEKAWAELDLDEHLRCAEIVAQAIQAAHEAQLVHRDLKPSNIMLEMQHDGKWRPYVLDFGLARDLAGATLTQEAVFFGTPSFVAPEQARGERVDHRADIYSLGATMFFALTGRPPLEAVLGPNLLSQITAFDASGLAKDLRAFPKDVGTVVLKCLESDPFRRYQTAAELAEDLGRLRAGEPILARPTSLAYRLKKKAQRNRAMVAVAGTAALLVLGFALLGLRARWNANRQAHWAQHFGQEAERIESLVRYANILPLHDTRPELEQVRERLRRLEVEIREAGSLGRAPGNYALGRAWLALGDASKARTLLERAWGDGFQTPETSYALGRALAALYDEALTRAQAIPDRELREAQIHQAEQRYRDPALEHLKMGRGASLEPVAFQETLLAAIEHRDEEALAKSRETLRQAPWFYEAKRMEADILFRRAQGLQDGAASVQALPAAVEAYREAQRTAPSDVSLYRGEAHAWQEVLLKNLALGRTSKEAMASGLAVCRRVQEVNPGSADALGLMAWFNAAYGRELVGRHQDARPALEAALRLVETALQRDPTNREALSAGLMAQAWYGVLLEEPAGADPRPAFNAAIALGNRLLEIDPFEVYALEQMNGVLVWKMAYESRAGLDPTATWEFSRALTERALARYPDIAYFHRQLGYVLVEWAEYLRLHGQNPTELTARAVKALERSLQLSPGAPITYYALGNAHLIQGDYEMNIGGDPVPELQAAARAFDPPLPSHASNPSFLCSLAVAHLDLATHCEEAGRDPSAELEVVRRTLGHVQQNPRESWKYLQEAQATLCEGRWNLRLKRNLPSGLFGQIDHALAQVTDGSYMDQRWTTQAERWLLQAQVDRNADALTQGATAARRALDSNPKCAQALLVLGKLESLRGERTRNPEQRGGAFRRATEALQQALRCNGNLAREIRPLLDRLKASG